MRVNGCFNWIDMTVSTKNVSYTFVYVCVYIYIYMYLYVDIYLFIYICVYMYVCTYICMYVYIYVWVCECTWHSNRHTCLYSFTHAYIGGHDSFICVTWIIHMLNATHSYVIWLHAWYDSSTCVSCVTWLIHTGGAAYLLVVRACMRMRMSISRCLYVCLYVCACAYVCMYVYTHIQTGLPACIYTHIHTYTRTRASADACMYMRIFSMYMRTHVYTLHPCWYIWNKTIKTKMLCTAWCLQGRLWHLSSVRYADVCVAVRCSVLQCVAVCCSLLQCVAVCCSVLQPGVYKGGHPAATHCNTLQHTATHCNTLQHTATHCNTCNTLQRTATRLWHLPSVRYADIYSFIYVTWQFYAWDSYNSSFLLFYSHQRQIKQRERHCMFSFFIHI